MALKWGIVAASRISHDFVTALSTLPTEDHQVVSIAARSLASAQEFAKLHGIPVAHEGYAALAHDTNVEIVYIGALNNAHFEIGMLLLENGKHILCEKPLSMNEKQAQALTSLAQKKKLFFMEAIWSRFFPTYQYVKKQIDAGVLGEIKRVDVEFGFDHKNSERTTLKELGAGVTLDQGLYCIQVSQWAFRETPISIEVQSSELNEFGVDQKVTATLKYRTGVTNMHITCSEFLGNKAVINGTKGSITINHFWSPTSLIDVDGTEKTWELPQAKQKFNYPNSCGLHYEAEAVRKCIRAGLTQCETVTHADSVLIARVQDEIRRQVGVSYPEDEE